jgi:hypothetical protein
VVDVAEVLALLVGERVEMLGAAEDLHAAQPARALADARGVDAGGDLRAGVEQRVAGQARGDDRLGAGGGRDGHLERHRRLLGVREMYARLGCGACASACSCSRT